MKTVRYGYEGQYSQEVADKDADEFAIQHDGYVESDEPVTETETRESVTFSDEELKADTTPSVETSESSTPLFDEVRQSNDPFKGQTL